MRNYDSAQDRRQFPRLQAPIYSTPAQLRLTPYPVADIGFGGMRVYSDEASSVGQVLDLELMVGQESTVRCTVEVAWVSSLPDGSAAKYDVGLRFVQVPPGFLHRLARLSKAEPSQVLAVVVNRGTAAATVDSLQALMMGLADDDDTRIVVVDEDPQAGSVDHISEAVQNRGWSELVSVIADDGHAGFGSCVNTAIRRGVPGWAGPDFVYLIDSTASPDPGAVRALTDILIGFSDVGIVGSRIHDVDGNTLPSAFRFPGLSGESRQAMRVGTRGRSRDSTQGLSGRSTMTGPVDWVTRTSMMVRREVFDAVGLFDESLRHDFVEIDFCQRARKSGWSTFFVHQSAATRSAPHTAGRIVLRDRHIWLASRQRYIQKTYGPVRRIIENLGFGAALALAWILRRENRAMFGHFLQFIFRMGQSARPSRRQSPTRRLLRKMEATISAALRRCYYLLS